MDGQMDGDDCFTWVANAVSKMLDEDTAWQDVDEKVRCSFKSKLNSEPHISCTATKISEIELNPIVPTSLYADLSSFYADIFLMLSLAQFL